MCECMRAGRGLSRTIVMGTHVGGGAQEVAQLLLVEPPQLRQLRLLLALGLALLLGIVGALGQQRGEQEEEKLVVQLRRRGVGAHEVVKIGLACAHTRIVYLSKWKD